MGALLAAAGIGAVGTIGGALLSKQSSPTVAPPLDIGKIASTAVNSNAQNLTANENLASQTNAFDQNQATSLINQALPGFSAAQAALMKASAGYQQNATSGTLGASQTSQIEQFAAEQGVSRGTSGQFNGFDVVKDFGENLQAYQQSQQNLALGTLSSAYGMAPRINPMSPSSMFVSPGQALGVAQNNQQQQQAGYNAQAAAGNANASTAGSAFSSVGGLFAAYALAKGQQPAAGVGGPTSYAGFLANNPQSSAAVGQVAATK